MKWLHEWLEERRRRHLERILIPADLWRSVSARWLSRYHLSTDELTRLRELASRFLEEKSISAGGADHSRPPSDEQCVVIAALACLPVLELGLAGYDGWYEVILYPETFVVHHQEIDASGVVHERQAELGGESWGHGPVILSWSDIESLHVEEGYNVVFHEFAHKLDMLSGGANGRPPLHAEMDAAEWTRVFQTAFDELRADIDHGRSTWLDPYGAENEGEFFAVVSEEFFELPADLRAHQPALYEQLRRFYRQDPAARIARARD